MCSAMGMPGRIRWRPGEARCGRRRPRRPGLRARRPRLRRSPAVSSTISGYDAGRGWRRGSRGTSDLRASRGNRPVCGRCCGSGRSYVQASYGPVSEGAPASPGGRTTKPWPTGRQRPRVRGQDMSRWGESAAQGAQHLLSATEATQQQTQTSESVGRGRWARSKSRVGRVDKNSLMSSQRLTGHGAATERLSVAPDQL